MVGQLLIRALKARPNVYQKQSERILEFGGYSKIAFDHGDAGVVPIVLYSVGLAECVDQ